MPDVQGRALQPSPYRLPCWPHLIWFLSAAIWLHTRLQGRWQPCRRRVTPCAHRCHRVPMRTSSSSSKPLTLLLLSLQSTRSLSSLHTMESDVMHISSLSCAGESAAAAGGCCRLRRRCRSHCRAAPLHRSTRSSSLLHGMAGDAMRFLLPSCAGESAATVVAVVRGCHYRRRRRGSHCRAASVLLSCPLQKLFFCGRALVLQGWRSPQTTV